MSTRRLALVSVVPVMLAVAAGAWLLVHGGGSTPTEALAAPHFVDETGSSGVEHTYDGDSRFFVGGGIATLDCDADALPDLFLAGGSNPAALYRNASQVGGALRFEHLTDAATDLTDVTGAYPLDIDGDGVTDLAVLRVGENVLLRGLGDCRFERANERWGLDGGEARTMAFAATWEADDGLPTLAVGDFIPLTQYGTPVPPCPDNQLWRPSSEGGTYGEPIPLTPGYCPLSMLFSDWDRSGRRDLRVSNDRQYYTDGEEQLWKMEPGQAPVAYTAADGWSRLQVWGMGIASQDLTGDGVALHWPTERLRAVMRASSSGRAVHVAIANPESLEATAVEPVTHRPWGLDRLARGEAGAMDVLAPGSALTLRLELEVMRTT